MHRNIFSMVANRLYLLPVFRAVRVQTSLVKTGRSIEQPRETGWVVSPNLYAVLRRVAPWHRGTVGSYAAVKTESWFLSSQRCGGTSC